MFLIRHFSPSFQCSFLPKFDIVVETCYENNNGTTVNAHNLNEAELSTRIIDYIDIIDDPIPDHKYKDTEDPKKVKILKTKPMRGPLTKNWTEDKSIPCMCAYKIVKAKFEVWGLQTKVEQWTQKVIR
jgi:hypothetical protein